MAIHPGSAEMAPKARTEAWLAKAGEDEARGFGKEEVFPMGRPQEVSNLLREGLSPREIAHKLGVTRMVANKHLYAAIAEGLIKRSDLLFSIPAPERAEFEEFIEKTQSVHWFQIWQTAAKSGSDLDEHHLKPYLRVRDVRLSMGDMYEFLLSLEVTLHDVIKAVLRVEYGDPDWWRKGVPQQVRVECAQLLEQDSDPASEPYCYTSFIHLREILDKQWALFASCLPGNAANDRKVLLQKLVRLNGIRNRVMHPVKGGTLTPDDFQFVREFHLLMKPANWRPCPELSVDTGRRQSRA